MQLYKLFTNDHEKEVNTEAGKLSKHKNLHSKITTEADRKEKKKVLASAEQLENKISGGFLKGKYKTENLKLLIITKGIWELFVQKIPSSVTREDK